MRPRPIWRVRIATALTLFGVFTWLNVPEVHTLDAAIITAAFTIAFVLVLSTGPIKKS
jgi:hypothetical protein